VSALVIDTSSWISFLAGGGDDRIPEWLEEGRVHLPPIVAAELCSGKLSPRQRRELEALLGDLPLCDAGLDHWLRVGELRAALRAKGLSVSTPDAHVARCALDLGAELLTEDRIFASIARHAGLKLA
jgi:predicted nucleic acid-binding protein